MAKDVITLGINDGHNAGAALVRNGDVAAAIQEERLVNEKNYSGVPRRAIHEGFRISGVQPGDGDGGALVGRNRGALWRVRLSGWIPPCGGSHWWSRFYVGLLGRRRRMGELRAVLRELN